MGLAGPRKRTKISHDPNNTQWTCSETSFGKKILQSHGWTPGSLLGAENAAHAHLHTAANASHVRVTLKDDNLGLGAKKGSGQADGECIGLDAFQGLLGRLNGKSDDQLEKEEKSREDLRRSIYMESRWGQMRFVKAGLLVGNKVYGLEEPAPETPLPVVKNEDGKWATPGEVTASGDGASKPRKKKDKRRKDKEKSSELDPSSRADSPIKELVQRKRKLKKRKLEDPRQEIDPATISTYNADPYTDPDPATAASESKLKRRLERQEKREKKAAKRLKKESAKAEKAQEGDATHAKKEVGDNTSSSGDDHKSKDAIVESVVPVTAVSSLFMGGRHAVRQRYILQKKMAVADSKAMNEIFMIKA